MGTGAQAVIGPRAIGNDAQTRFNATQIFEQVVGADGPAIVHARYGSGEILQYFTLLLDLLRQEGSHPAHRSHLGYLLEVNHQLCRGGLPFNSELQPPRRAGGFNTWKYVTR